ncbi:MAG: phytanoyl-CoA dioxygenase family protein [Planctomycetota bacterium]
MTASPSVPSSTPAGLDLDTPYALNADDIARFRKDGFVRLPHVFSAEELAAIDGVLTPLTLAHAPDTAMEDRDTYAKAFIQVGNLWERSDDAKPISFSRRLARIATELLGTAGVRMWHDQCLYKEAGGGFTPWHVDQQYWPMDSPLSVTAWIPLQETPIEMGPLCFGKGSHQRKIGRELAISDASERLIDAEVKKNKIDEVYEAYGLGDVSFHYGWTLHRAGPNTTGKPRKVHTVIYMDRDMKLIEPKTQAHRNDWASWTPSTKVGEVMDDPRNPVLYAK